MSTTKRKCEFCENLLPRQTQDTVCKPCDEGLKHFDPKVKTNACKSCGERTPNRFHCGNCWEHIRGKHDVGGNLIYFASPATYEVLPKRHE